MPEATQIARFGQDNQRRDRSDARQGTQTLVVRTLLQELMCAPLQGSTLLVKRPIPGKLQPERFNGQAILAHWKSDAPLSEFVQFLELRALVDLATDDVPGCLDKSLAGERLDRSGCRKAKHETDEPIIACGVPVAFDLRKIQRQ